MKNPARIAVVASRFNEDVTSRLLSSCLRTLKEAGWDGDRVRVLRVPGGFELPWAVQEAALTGRYAAVIALGCILKGQTPQNEHLARSTIQHLHSVSLATRVPCVLGVVTPQTLEQALARTRGELDRGREAALAALEMARLRTELGSGRKARRG